ncbi:MAG: hypothetical protein AB2L14_32755 [Candidatus Xenobiia bacterium LiM19]
MEINEYAGRVIACSRYFRILERSVPHSGENIPFEAEELRSRMESAAPSTLQEKEKTGRILR